MAESKKTYEGMFLLDAGAGEFETASAPVRTVLERSEAEVLALKPWDERKLAYPIAGRRRGLYVLSYFKVAPGRTAEIERDCQLNEQILRVLILHREKLADEEIQAETPATRGKKSSRPDRRDKSGDGAAKESTGAEAQAKEAEPQAPQPPKQEAPAAREPARSEAGGEAPPAGGDGAAEQTAAGGAPAEQTPPASGEAPREPAGTGEEGANQDPSSDQAGATG